VDPDFLLAFPPLPIFAESPPTHNCCYEVPIARERPIRERKKLYERRKRLYIFQMVACFSRISTAELVI